MLSGTLVTVAGFIPIALAKSSTGEYAFAFFQINAIALVISWLAAVVAIPWLGYKLLPNPRAPQQPGLIERRLPRLAQLLARLGLARRTKPGSSTPHSEDHDVYGTPFYNHFRKLVGWCVKRRWLVIGLTVALFALSIFGMGQGTENSSSRIRHAWNSMSSCACLRAPRSPPRMPKPNGLRNGSTRTRPSSISSSITSLTSVPAHRAITWASTSNCPPPTSASLSF
jgi:hypothetical protein